MRYSLGLVKPENVSSLIPLLSDSGMGAEISMFDYSVVSQKSIQWFLSLSRQFSQLRLPLSFHAPIYDINPISKDEFIKRYSERFLTLSLELAFVASGEVLVMHTGMPSWLPAGGNLYKEWLDRFVSFMSGFLRRLEGESNPPKIALENTTERDISVFEDIFSALEHPNLGMCLDTAHALCYQKVQPYEIVKRFSSKIIHFHISDNEGMEDIHLKVGEGKIDFESFAEEVKKANLENAIMVIELPLEDAKESVEHLNSIFSGL